MSIIIIQNGSQDHEILDEMVGVSVANRLDNEDLNSAFIAALGARVRKHGDLASKPLELDLDPPLPHRIRVYIYNATDPPGGRTVGEHKIQLIVPEQKSGERGNFDYSDGRIVVLAGYRSDLDVFILWDADLYSEFTYSRNLQVRAETVYSALAKDFEIQERRLRNKAVERVIAATGEHLAEALELRLEFARERLSGG